MSAYSYQSLGLPGEEAADPSSMWQTPVQDSPYLPERRVEGVRAMMAALQKDWLTGGGKPKTRLYVPKLPNQCSDLSRMTTRKPADAAQWPGYDVWDTVTTNMWLEQITEFAQVSAFEMIDLQSDITLAVSIFVDTAYSGVPIRLKIYFIVLTALSILLEVAIAFRQALRAWEDVEMPSKNWRYLAMCTYLNWIATPVNIIVAPKRFAAFGMHRFGRNLGSIIESDGMPIVMSGQSGNIDYLHTRTFFVRMPKVFLENILLFALTLYIQNTYVERWSAAALFSVASSTTSLAITLWKTVHFWLSARRAKRYFENACRDEEGYVAPYDKNFAVASLSQGCISCPLL